MDESSHDSIGIAECYFCGFRLLSDEQDEMEDGEGSPGFPKAKQLLSEDGSLACQQVIFRQTPDTSFFDSRMPM
jgi:hypothetical protein